tara:strand:+ start:311 stop:499 length:189 start_codon:yes stop_codon:yes gene_type:complete
MRGQIIKAPSGAMVEISEFKDLLIIVYQLDKNNNRIPERKIDGGTGFLKGIITNEKVKNQLK